MTDVPKFHYIGVHGTWDLAEDSWWRHGSPFCKLAAENGLHCEEEFETFFWNGAIDGVSLKTVLTLGLLRDRHYTWMASGLSLRNRLRLSALKDRNLIVHSYGLSVLAYAEIEVNNIISVGSPIRNDLSSRYRALRNRCNRWMHIYDTEWDHMAYLGQLFDGRWFGTRRCEFAHENCRLKHIGHSKILRDPVAMQKWKSEGWYDFLKMSRRDERSAA